MLYSFRRKNIGGTPGTGNFAFEPFTTLPKYSVGGTGITYLRGMRAIQEPQAYIDAAQIEDGMNGITFGQVQSQPLANYEEILAVNMFNPPEETDALFRP